MKFGLIGWLGVNCLVHDIKSLSRRPISLTFRGKFPFPLISSGDPFSEPGRFYVKLFTILGHRSASKLNPLIVEDFEYLLI